MKYRFSILIIALISTCLVKTSWSQKLTTISGIVVSQKSPLEYAQVLLYKTSDTTHLLMGTTTNSSGSFSFSITPATSYFLKIQLLGYTPKRIQLSVDNTNTPVLLDKIQLSENATTLKSVEVLTQRKMIQKTATGFTIQAKDNISQASGTATDLLSNVPTVVVDADGVITIRGKSPLILVNGRNSGLSSTDRIPASSVESIEIINNPSAQYDADAEGGIINIKLKKNTANGTNGSIAVGAGYGARPRGNASLNLNHQQGKWNFDISYDTRVAERIRKANAVRTNFDLPQEYTLLQNRNDKRFEQTHNIKLDLDFNLNKNNTFNLEAIGNYEGQNNSETLQSKINNQQAAFVSNNTRHSSEIGKEMGIEVALNYQRKFDDKRKSLAVNLSTSQNHETENTDITTKSLTATDSIFGNPFLQRTFNYQNSNISNFKIDYKHPIAKRGTLEMGYKGIVRFTDANFQSQYFTNNEYVANPQASNIFRFTEQIHAVYFQYRGYEGHEDSVKWRYDFGVRFEQVYNTGKAVSNNISFLNNYVNIFPTANVAYYFKPSDFLKFSFSRRINRPNLGQLNPFLDITDSLNPHSGNPYLQPELVNALEIGYNKEWKKFSFTTNAFYRYSTNIIRQNITLNNNGVALVKPINFGNATTLGMEGIFSAYPFKFWTINASVSFYQQRFTGSIQYATPASNVFSWYGKLINNFTIWKGSKLQLIANYNSPIATPQGTRIAVYNVDAGFQQKLLKGKAAIGLVVQDIFNTQKSGVTASASNFNYSRTFKVDSRAFFLTFVYSFRTTVKEEQMENRFSND